MYNIVLSVLLKRPGAGYLLFWRYRGIIIVIIITIISLASQTALGESRYSRTTVKQKPWYTARLEAVPASQDDGWPGLEPVLSASLFVCFTSLELRPAFVTSNRVAWWVVRQALFHRALSHTQTYIHTHIHTRSPRASFGY